LIENTAKGKYRYINGLIDWDTYW